MKKRLIAAALVLLGTLLPAAAGESQAQAAAEQLYCLGLLNGAGTNPDGTPDFNLGGTMTRGEAIIMVVRLSGYEGQALSRDWDHPFTDVEPWAGPYVGLAYAKGISQGVSESVFGFSDQIDQAQYLTLLLRILGYKDTDWYDPYPAAALAGLTEGEDYRPGTAFLRGDMCILSRSVLDARMAGESCTLLEALERAGALVPRELPEPAPVFTPGPTITAGNSITVSSPEDMLAQFAVQVDARNINIVIYPPRGQEEAYSAELLRTENMDRFPDVDTLSCTSYPGQGRMEVTVLYRDHARVMAYIEGKITQLSESDLALYQRAVQIHSALADPTMSEYQQVKAFHDYLCETVTYTERGQASHTAYGALVDGAAVCQGYTQAMDLLCFLSGIDCEYIFGSSRGQNHSWVRVNVEGQWYNVDTTWDDQVSHISYEYFLRSDEFMARDHTWKSNPNWPVCPADYSAGQ